MSPSCRRQTTARACIRHGRRAAAIPAELRGMQGKPLPQPADSQPMLAPHGPSRFIGPTREWQLLAGPWRAQRCDGARRGRRRRTPGSALVSACVCSASHARTHARLARARVAACVRRCTGAHAYAAYAGALARRRGKLAEAGTRGQRRRAARHWSQCLATQGTQHAGTQGTARCGDWLTRPTTIIRAEPGASMRRHSRAIDPIGTLLASAAGASGESSAAARERGDRRPTRPLPPCRPCLSHIPRALSARAARAVALRSQALTQHT